jgi:hypothetical protein
MTRDRSTRRAARRRILPLAIGTALAAQLHAATAGEGSWGAAAHAGWQDECATCHVAYPPRLLPAASWRQLMGTLDRHFGSDATIDPALARDISAFLERNAGRPERLRADAAVPRVTRTEWFVRKHDEVPAAVWSRPAIGSPVNCAACHTQAAQGDFRERNIRIPR